MDLKPGWKTSEFWLSAIAKAAAALVAFGVLNAEVSSDVTRHLSDACVGVFAILSVISLAKTYCDSRTELKREAKSAAPALAFMLGLAFLFGGTSPAWAQAKAQAPVVQSTREAPAKGYAWLEMTNQKYASYILLQNGRPVGLWSEEHGYRPLAADGKGAFIVSAPALCPVAPPPLVGVGEHRAAFLPWRERQERELRELQRQRDDLQRQLQDQRQQPQQQPIIIEAPRPEVHIILLPGPQQSLPIGGAPYQYLPIQGAPQQQLPIQGAPQQVLPQPGPPQQSLPLGGPPRQQLLPGEAKPTPQPGEVRPAPSGPGNVRPQQNLPAVQRYTPAIYYRRGP